MITKEEALEALDAMDDYARMDVGVDAYGPRGVLMEFIEQSETTHNEWVYDDLGGGHNGEYTWYHHCGASDWFCRNTDPNKEKIPCRVCDTKGKSK